VNRRKIALPQGAFIWLLAVTVAGVALAAPDARSKATAILAGLAKKPDAARVASESIDKANDALRRAEQLRKSGEQKRGGMLEETALEWAEASEQLDKTAQSEKQLAELQTRTTELETKVFRAQALVEQTVARRARAEEALRKLGEKGGKP
jgi:flagellar hook-basal body complex protein FliE